jgi:putative oxidoreductase
LRSAFAVGTDTTRLLSAESKPVGTQLTGLRKDLPMKTPFLLGRVIFGGFFIYSGIHHFQQKKEMAQYAGAKHVPMPELAVTATGAALVAGGTSILLGVKPKLGALTILGFLAGVSPIMHDFWTKEDPMERQNDMVNFMKNLAMAGAALTLMGMEEPWPASLPIGQPSTAEQLRRFTRNIAA